MSLNIPKGTFKRECLGEGPKALIDGDIIMHSVANASDGRHYLTSDGINHNLKADAIAYCVDTGLDPEDIRLAYDPEPKVNALHNAKLMVQSILKETDASDYEIFITGKGNFRTTLATIQNYKGNRDAYHVPYHLENVKEYFINSWGATVIDGEEADDAMGIYQTEDTIICTLDKDLDQIAGKHYRWSFMGNASKIYEVSPEWGMRLFYSQLLTGDSTDNILGLFGVGPKSVAVRYIKEKAVDELDMFTYVRDAYKNRYGNFWRYFLNENAQLLWIRREHGKPWKMPETGEEGEDFTISEKDFWDRAVKTFECQRVLARKKEEVRKV